MNETIGLMLSLSRIEEGSVRIDNSEIELRDLFEEIRSNSELQYREKKIQCFVECEEGLMITTDRNLLKEAISNLWSNAIHYTPEEGKVILRGEREGKNKLRIEVEDNGFGIPKHQQDKIFTKFFRADNVIEKKTDGTGLGLYLVYSIAELFKGNISFSSEENKGTTFTMILPISPPTQDE